MEHFHRTLASILGLLLPALPALAGELVHGDTLLMVGPPPGVTIAEAESPQPETPEALTATAMESAEPDLPSGVVVVDPARMFQAVRGFGGQADYELLGAPGRADGVTRADYDYVIRECVANGVTWARVGLPAWEDTNDNDDPAKANRESFEQQFAYHYPGLVEHLVALRQAGIEPLPVLWGFPGWMLSPDGKLKDGMLPELVENCAMLLQFLKEKGVPVGFFSIVNEPPWGASIGDPATLAEAVRLLGVRLAEMKLDVHLVAPDISGDLRRIAGGWVEPLLTKASPYVDMIALHGYAFSQASTPSDMAPFHAALALQLARRGAGGRTPEIWYTEYNGHWFGNADEDRRAVDGPCDGWMHGMKMAELTHHLLSTGVNLALVWELYDVRRAIEEKEPKRWGMMKYKTEGWAKRPEYYTVGMYSRFIRPGYRIVGCRASRTGAPLALAALGTRELVVVLNNPTPAASVADVVLGIEPAGSTADVWLTTRRVPFSESWRPIRGGRVYVDLPPLSLATIRVPIQN